MTITARTAPKFCAHIRAALPEIFFLDLVSLVISGTIEPWPECQPEETCFISLWARAGTQAPHMGPGRARAHPPIPLLPSYASLVCSTSWPLSQKSGPREPGPSMEAALMHPWRHCERDVCGARWWRSQVHHCPSKSISVFVPSPLYGLYAFMTCSCPSVFFFPGGTRCGSLLRCFVGALWRDARLSASRGSPPPATPHPSEASLTIRRVGPRLSTDPPPSRAIAVDGVGRGADALSPVQIKNHSCRKSRIILAENQESFLQESFLQEKLRILARKSRILARKSRKSIVDPLSLLLIFLVCC